MHKTTYTATLDVERRLPLLGDALHAQYRVHHRADGVIELRPEAEDSPVSALTLQTIGRSVESLGRGETSAPVDLDETFPDGGGHGALPASGSPPEASLGALSYGDTAHRVLAALHRSAARARRVAAQTGTRLVVVRDGELVVEPVSDAASAEAPPSEPRAQTCPIGLSWGVQIRSVATRSDPFRSFADTPSSMVSLRITRRLLSASSGRKRGSRVRDEGALLSDGPPPEPGPLGTWYVNVVALPYPGRSLVLFTAADTMLSVVASGRSLRTTVPVFQRRVPILLLRLGLPGAWIQARAGDLADVHVARAGAQTLDRTVLGTMTDASYQIRAEAEAAGTFDRLDLDAVEDGLAQVPLGALRSEHSSHGFPADAVAELARG